MDLYQCLDAAPSPRKGPDQTRLPNREVRDLVQKPGLDRPGGPRETRPAHHGASRSRNRACSRTAEGPRRTNKTASRKCWLTQDWARAAAVSNSFSRGASPSTARSSASSVPRSTPPAHGSPSMASRSSSSRWSITPSTSPKGTSQRTPTHPGAHASSTCCPRFRNASTPSAGWTRRVPDLLLFDQRRRPRQPDWHTPLRRGEGLSRIGGRPGDPRDDSQAHRGRLVVRRQGPRRKRAADRQSPGTGDHARAGPRRRQENARSAGCCPSSATQVMSLLNRIAVGPVSLKGLSAGECRSLSRHEIELLRKVASGDSVAPPRFFDGDSSSRTHGEPRRPPRPGAGRAFPREPTTTPPAAMITHHRAMQAKMATALHNGVHGTRRVRTRLTRARSVPNIHRHAQTRRRRCPQTLSHQDLTELEKNRPIFRPSPEARRASRSDLGDRVASTSRPPEPLKPRRRIIGLGSKFGRGRSTRHSRGGKPEAANRSKAPSSRARSWKETDPVPQDQSP